jgi:CRP/FNR family transcriptional regulator, dissimilatory nitrate respiration regulator
LFDSAGCAGLKSKGRHEFCRSSWDALILIWIKVGGHPADNHCPVVSSQIQVRELLKNVSLFGELVPENLDLLAAGAAQVRADAGTVLFRRGEPCTGFYIIVYGQVKLAFSGAEGAEKVVEILGPGQSFGEPLMFVDQPHVGFAETLTDSLLLRIGKAALLAEIDRNPRFARKMLADLAQRLQRLIADIEAYSLMNSTQRVIGYLLRDVAAGAPIPLEIKLPATKGVVASRLSITREHFSRVLHELWAAGLIEVHGRTVRVIDAERLRAWEA